MDHVDTSRALGRYPFTLTRRWTAVFLEPLPGVLALGLFLDGVPVEVIGDEDARAHLAGLARRRRVEAGRATVQVC